jgi:hypothetical protein
MEASATNIRNGPLTGGFRRGFVGDGTQSLKAKGNVNEEQCQQQRDNEHGCCDHKALFDVIAREGHNELSRAAIARTVMLL